MKYLRSAKHRALVAIIKEAREAAGLTQRELAEKLKRSHNFVWKIEAGERNVGALELGDIASATGQDAGEMLSRALRGG